MRYIGIDLHKQNIVVAVGDSRGSRLVSRTFSTGNVVPVILFFKRQTPFTAVIEASCSYRWLYDLLSPLGEVKIAHPLRLRAIVSGRAKTDKLDSAMLAKLLMAGMIPESYVPPRPYQDLRDITRARARLSRNATKAKNEIHALLARANCRAPYRSPFGPRGRRWLLKINLGAGADRVKSELVRRLEHYESELDAMDAELKNIAGMFPEIESLQDIHGFGLYSSLLVTGEIGEPWRFPSGEKVAAYAGLTARVNQSGSHSYHGHITRQGSPWLRWILVQAAMHVTRRDVKLRNFYQRVRKRSSAKIARVAVARKLAVISWVRLKMWHRRHGAKMQYCDKATRVTERSGLVLMTGERESSPVCAV